MIHARSDGNDVLPVVQRTFSGGVPAGGNHRTVGTKGYGMAVPGGHGHHIGPVLHLALAIGAVPGGDDGAVLPNPDGVVLPGGDGHNVRPGFHVALAKLVVSGGQNGAILPEGHSVQAACRHHPPHFGAGNLLFQRELDPTEITVLCLVPQNPAAMGADPLHLRTAHITKPSPRPQFYAAGFAFCHGQFLLAVMLLLLYGIPREKTTPANHCA